MVEHNIILYGTGNFLKGFVGPILQRLAAVHKMHFRLHIVKPTPSWDSRLDEWLQNDGKYHVITKGIADGKIVDETTVINHVKTIVQPQDHYDAYLDLADLDASIIISNTTEAGLAFDSSDTGVHICANSYPGKLTQLLYRRWQQKESEKQGYYIIPTELVENNGDVLRDLVMQYVGHWGLENEFAKWVTESNHFINNLVDRIVPGQPSDPNTDLSFNDSNAVQVEPYLLWALEQQGDIQCRFPIHTLAYDVVYAEKIMK